MTYRLGIIGGGNMGYSIARGAIRARVVDPKAIVVADTDPDRRAKIAEFGCTVVPDPREALDCEQLVLAVKPQAFAAVAEAIAPLARPTVVVTIMAGIDSAHIRMKLGPNARVIRVMPNTPCQLGEGMTGIALGAGAEAGDENLAEHLFGALGRTVTLDESLMHAVTAVSGSGPAYIYLLAELMEKAAQRIGLDPATAQLLVIQTIIGAGRMLRESGLDPEALRRIVTTPKGTTEAALDVMFERDLPTVWIDALTAARDRGIELGEANG